MNSFKKNTISLYGARGKAWLEQIPEQVNVLAKQHQLSHLKPVDNLSYNYVLSGFQQNVPIILKLGLDIDGLKREALALNAFSGFGSATVLAESDGLLLLERAIPGVSLKSYFPQKEDDTINIVCKLIIKLHQAPIPLNHSFPHIRDWLSALDKHWALPLNYLERARQLRETLLNLKQKQVLLHGDLHHDNILQNGNDWIMIDPKGVIGPAVCEIWPFVFNPQEMSKEFILNRIHLFSKILSIDKNLIISWCFVQSILSWIWDLEDNLKPNSSWLSDILYNMISDEKI